MRFRSFALFAAVSGLSLAAFGCVERQESAPQQQQPAAQPAATTPTKPTFNPQGIPIKKGVGMQGLVVGNGPQATPPPQPASATAAPAPSGSASK